MPNTSVLPRHKATHSPVTKPIGGDSDAVSAEFREFAYIVSHDLQGPARTMVEFTRLLLSDRAASIFEDEGLYLRLIIESGEKLQSMVAGLLAFSRLNDRVWVPQSLDMNALAKAVIHSRAKDLQGEADAFGGTDLPEVYADRMGVEQVLAALVDNALKFRRKDAALKLSLTADHIKGFVVFCVSDNGTGIGPDFCDEIFKPLRKLHTDDEYPGTGMGLTLARKIIETQGGGMWAKPNVEGGLSVFFTLPIRADIPCTV